LGSVLGVLPGGGAVLASFAAYTLEKKIKLKAGETPLGQGNIRGVAAPEAANNAGAQTSFIPLLTLGIPPNAVMALMVGAMTIHNIQPGPQVMTVNPELFWGLIASMWIGNLMLIVLNLPMIGLWIKLLTVPYHYLFPAIVLFCAIGVYTTNNATFDIALVAAFGFAGYLFYKLGCEPAPLLLGFVLGPMMEEYLKRALKLARGDWSVFITRPLSAALLAVAVILVVMVVFAACCQSTARHVRTKLGCWCDANFPHTSTIGSPGLYAVISSSPSITMRAGRTVCEMDSKSGSAEARYNCDPDFSANSLTNLLLPAPGSPSTTSGVFRAKNSVSLYSTGFPSSPIISNLRCTYVIVLWISSTRRF
jgi:hypothetical protein